jgi:hypothetical protein
MSEPHSTFPNCDQSVSTCFFVKLRITFYVRPYTHTRARAKYHKGNEAHFARNFKDIFASNFNSMITINKLPPKTANITHSESHLFYRRLFPGAFSIKPV